jgi:A/G-specific adenine glycosylase
VSEQLGGRFPEDEAALLALPGIGRYTAAAIRAIAFDQPASAVDGNVERVIARLYALETPLPDVKPEIQALAEKLVPRQRAGDYAQAMMDLGATVCTPKSPRCVICPLIENCQARQRGIAEDLPRRAPKADKPTRRGLAFVLARKDGAILLRKRPTNGLLGGMDEVPSSPWREGKLVIADALKEAPVPANWKVLDGGVRHTFTHFHLELAVARATAATAGLAKLAPGAAWVEIDRMTERALPTVMRKVIAHAVKS